MHDVLPEMNPNFEEVCAVLESISKAYEEGSKEAEAIRQAAEAYIYLQLHLQLKHSYLSFRRQSLEGLSEAQRQNLRDMGIDPDAEPELDVDFDPDED
jgi:hypothetical protein